MNIWEVDKLVLFLIFFIPGFISIKIYDLLIPGEQRDFSKSILEVIGYSALNYGALSWFIIWVFSSNLFQVKRVWFIIAIVFIVFVVPIIWPILFTRLWRWRLIGKYIIHPLKRPWDYVFAKREKYWMIIHLKDGRRIGGRFDENSSASSFPAKEQIYIEEVWELDENGKFIKPIKRSAGIIVLSNEILSVELFK